MKIVYPPSSLQGLEILSCSDGRPFGRHLHDGYVLWLNSESGEHFDVGGESAILEPGSVSLIEPGLVHSNRPCDASRRHLRSIYFTDDFLREMQTRTGARGPHALPTLTLRDPALWELLASLHQKMLQGASALGLEEDVLTAFTLLGRRCGRTESAPHPGREDQRLQRLTEYMHARLDSQISLSELAAIAGCTEFHVIRLFKRHLGMSPHAYVSQLRLENARRLIGQGRAIADAALESGLSDQSHLTRMFKQRYGVTPGQYRAQRGKA